MSKFHSRNAEPTTFQHIFLVYIHHCLTHVQAAQWSTPRCFSSPGQVGVKVFQFEAKGLSMYLHLRPTSPFEPTEEARAERVIWVLLSKNLGI